MKSDVAMPEELHIIPPHLQEKLHGFQFLAFELMSVLYQLREMEREESYDPVLINIWISESEEALELADQKIDEIQNTIIEINNTKSN